MPYTHHPPPGHELVWRAQGDYLQFYYLLWLFGEAVRGRAPWFLDPYQFVVPGVTQPVWTYFFPLSPVFFLFSPVSGPFAYNALVLLSFPASGVTMTLLARRLGVGWMAGSAAGVVFTLFPQRLAVLLGGQPTGFGFFLFPLVFLLTEIALARRSLGIALLSGLTILCLPTVDPHLLYFIGLVSPFYLWLRLPAWVAARPASDRLGRDSISLALPWAAAIALGLLLGLVAELFPGAPQSGPLIIRVALWLAGLLLLWLALSESLVLLRGDGWAAAQTRALGILSPLVAAFILRGLGSAISVPRLGLVLGLCGLVASGVLYLRVLGGPGARALVTQFRPLLPALGLAVLAVGYMLYVKQTVLEASVIGGGRSLDEIRLFAPTLADLFVRDQPHAARVIYPGAVAVLLAAVGVAGRGRRTAFLLTLLFVAAVLLSLGPTVRGLPLYDLFHRFVPFGAFIRQPAKFQLVAAFALALLVALGLSHLEAVRRWGRWLSALALMLVLADYAPARPAGLSTLSGNDAIYAKIRDEAGTGPVLYLPIWPGESSWSSVYLYATTLIRRPMVNGYAPAVPAAYPSAIYRPLDPMNFGEVRDEQHALLRRLRVRAVVFDRGVFPPKVTGLPSAFTLENLQASPFLEFVASENPFWLFRVRERPTGTPVFRRTSPQGIFFEAEWLPRRTGRVEEDAKASGGKILKAEEGRDLPGVLHFGPYRALPTGRYVAIFRLRGEGPHGSGPLARVEVTADRGERVLAQRFVDSVALSPRFDDVSLQFEVTRPEPLEYRLEWFGQGWLEADYVYVRFADEHDPRESFEVEALAHAMEERGDPQASGGVAAFADLRSPKAELLSGPYRRYPAGTYEATFRLRVERPSLAPVMRLAVALMPNRAVLAGTDVKGDPEGVGRYRDVSLLFRLERAGIIEFLAQYLGAAPIALDRITVRPIGQASGPPRIESPPSGG